MFSLPNKRDTNSVNPVGMEGLVCLFVVRDVLMKSKPFRVPCAGSSISLLCVLFKPFTGLLCLSRVGVGV